MVALVERMLELNKQKHSGGHRPPLQLEELERDIASTDDEIDDLVYELYAITAEGRKVIEGG